MSARGFQIGLIALSTFELLACSDNRLRVGNDPGVGGRAQGAAGAAGSSAPAGTGGAGSGLGGAGSGLGGAGVGLGGAGVGGTGSGAAAGGAATGGAGGAGGGAGTTMARFLSIVPVDSSGAPQTEPPYSVLLSGASDDGSVLAGTWSFAVNSGTNFYWSASTGVVTLEPPSDPNHTGGYYPNVTPDGTRLFGKDDAGFYRWTKQGGYELFAATLPSFTGPGASTNLAFSRDGAMAWGVAADSSHWLPFRWRPVDGVITYSSIAGWPADGTYADYLSEATCNNSNCGILRGASAFSDDDTVVAGYHQADPTPAVQATRGFIWSAPGTLYDLEPLPGTMGCNVAAFSRDGTTAFGSCSDPSAAVPGPSKAFRWTAASGMVPLGENIYYHDVIPDGRIAMGRDDVANVLHRWTAETGDVVLDPSGSAVDPARYAISMTKGSLSDDGGSAYGQAIRIDVQLGFEEQSPQDGFVWNTSRGFVLLDSLPGYDLNMISAAAPDGSVQIGTLGTRRGNPTYLPPVGVLWDCKGVRDIAAELTAAGFNLQGITIGPVRVWSGASIMIAGYGSPDDRHTSAWIAWLPSRC